ncbi:MAG TPA: LON peptidase substrate-binding domain-containing protein [Myxococcota bacterium]|nr:LON peptidase substrate-binding domain-containing protein [Myxococcota bacterium]
MGESELLPIFPLSNVVLFPRVKTPLHLFEPRYRQLARDVLQGERRIGMVAVRPEHLDEMPGDPPIYPVGCAGVITESHRQPDGRYNIVLLGEQRVRIVSEEPRSESRLYRVARVVRLEDTYPETDRARVARLRTAIAADVGMLIRRAQPDRAHAFDAELFAGVDDETFVNAVANAFAFPADEKQALLEAEGVPERYARLASALSFHRLEIESAGGGRRQLH